MNTIISIIFQSKQLFDQTIALKSQVSNFLSTEIPQWTASDQTLYPFSDKCEHIYLKSLTNPHSKTISDVFQIPEIAIQILRHLERADLAQAARINRKCRLIAMPLIYSQTRFMVQPFAEISCSRFIRSVNSAKRARRADCQRQVLEELYTLCMTWFDRVLFNGVYCEWPRVYKDCKRLQKYAVHLMRKWRGDSNLVGLIFDIKDREAHMDNALIDWSIGQIELEQAFPIRVNPKSQSRVIDSNPACSKFKNDLFDWNKKVRSANLPLVFDAKVYQKSIDFVTRLTFHKLMCDDSTLVHIFESTPSLTHLTISECVWITARPVTFAIHKLGRSLIYLRLPGFDSFNDSMARKIADTCCNLQFIDVSNCYNVGVDALTNMFYNCCDLRHVEIQRTDQTNRRVQPTHFYTFAPKSFFQTISFNLVSLEYIDIAGFIAPNVQDLFIFYRSYEQALKGFTIDGAQLYGYNMRTIAHFVHAISQQTIMGFLVTSPRHFQVHLQNGNDITIFVRVRESLELSVSWMDNIPWDASCLERVWELKCIQTRYSKLQRCTSIMSNLVRLESDEIQDSGLPNYIFPPLVRQMQGRFPINRFRVDIANKSPTSIFRQSRLRRGESTLESNQLRKLYKHRLSIHS